MIPMNRASMAKQVSQGPMKKVKKYQEGGLIDRSEAKRRRETAANTVRTIDAMPSPRSRMARNMAETGLDDTANETRRLNQDNMKRNRTGGEPKSQEAAEYKKGGKVSAKPVKMQKGGMVPCKGCKNPAACKKAGQCLAKA